MFVCVVCTYIYKDAIKNINLLVLNLNYLGRSTKLMNEVKKQVESMYDKAFLKLDGTKVIFEQKGRFLFTVCVNLHCRDKYFLEKSSPLPLRKYICFSLSQARLQGTEFFFRVYCCTNKIQCKKVSEYDKTCKCTTFRFSPP